MYWCLITIINMLLNGLCMPLPFSSRLLPLSPGKVKYLLVKPSWAISESQRLVCQNIFHSFFHERIYGQKKH